MVAHGVDPNPILDQLDYVFGKVLAPSTSSDPQRRLNHLCDRLWLIAAIEHYTAVIGDFALNCSWDDYGADPDPGRRVPLARQRRGRAPQRRA